MSSERRKLSKSELREDEFVEWIMQAIEYVKERTQLFVGGAVAVIAVIVAINYFIESEETNRLQAAALLGDVLMVEQGGDFGRGDPAWPKSWRPPMPGRRPAAQGDRALGQSPLRAGPLCRGADLLPELLGQLRACGCFGLCGPERSGCLSRSRRPALGCGPALRKRMRPNRPGTIREAMARMEAARIYGLAGDSDKQQALLEEVSRTFAQYPIAAQGPRGPSPVLRGRVDGEYGSQGLCRAEQSRTGRGHLPVAGH